MIATAVALWLAASPLIAWLAGRFIRVGMVELQPILGVHASLAEPRHQVLTQSQTETCAGCRHDGRTSGPISLVDLRPIQLCRLDQPRLWADRRCACFQEAKS